MFWKYIPKWTKKISNIWRNNALNGSTTPIVFINVRWTQRRARTSANEEKFPPISNYNYSQYFWKSENSKLITMKVESKKKNRKKSFESMFFN